MMPADKTSSAIAPTIWFIVPLVLALAGTWGSLYLSIGMELKACPLCFYQRTFVMSVLAVLVMGWLADRTQGGLFCLLCIPLTVGGLGVAVFHEYLVVTEKLECPKGLLGLGTAPAQSLAFFVALTATITWSARTRLAWLPGGVLLGLVLAWACVASAPPMPGAPAEPYMQPADTCRPPYRGG